MNSYNIPIFSPIRSNMELGTINNTKRHCSVIADLFLNDIHFGVHTFFNFTVKIV